MQYSGEENSFELETEVYCVNHCNSLCIVISLCSSNAMNALEDAVRTLVCLLIIPGTSFYYTYTTIIGEKLFVTKIEKCITKHFQKSLIGSPVHVMVSRRSAILSCPAPSYSVSISVHKWYNSRLLPYTSPYFNDSSFC